MYGIKWVYLDLDGTIVDDENKMSNRTIMASMYLKSKGVNVGVATGRSYFFARQFSKALGVNLPIICLNGAWIMKRDNFSTIKEEFILPDQKREILKILDENYIDFIAFTSEGVYSSSPDVDFFKKLKIMRESENSKLDYDFSVIKDRRFFWESRILKFSISFSNELEKNKFVNLMKTVENIKCLSSQNNVLDIFSLNVDKSLAIKWIMEQEDIKKHEIMVFGDNENDVEMFKMFNKSVVVCDAKEKIKRYAKYKTDFSCKDEGVADFIFRNF